MRPISFLAILTLATTALPLHAQPYLPLVKENRYWIYSRMELGEIPVHITGAFALYFSGDTIMQGLAYKKLVAHNLKVAADAKSIVYPYQIISPPTPYGFFREDSLARQVYYRPLPGSAHACSPDEHLLYDFSLQEGDTLNACVTDKIYFPNLSLCDTPTVDSIRLEMRRGQLRRAFYTTGWFEYVGDPPCSTGVLDEGFGYDQYGLINFGGPSYLTPYTPLRDYCEGSLQTCGFVSSADDWTLPEAELSVFPNPAGDYVRVKHPVGICKGDWVLKIFDLSGKTWISTSIDACTTKTLDIQEWPEGLYFLQIRNAGHLRSGKFLVQRR